MKQPNSAKLYNTALYMRLSRDDENYGDSVSIETQRTILRQYAKEQCLPVVDEYVDNRIRVHFYLSAGPILGRTSCSN